MEQEHYFHMFANGDDAKNFITSEKEFKLAFNRFAVCQHVTGVVFVAGSVEDSHPHALLYGRYSDCLRFKNLYEDLSIRSIIQQRGSKDGVVLCCELEEVIDESYLMNVATYTITQATKDGKAIMPYDYLYGTGALYFRSPHTILPWMVDEQGNYVKPVRYGDLMVIQKLSLCATKIRLPDGWLVCNGFVLPTNYVDVRRFESIYRTHNCFRVFLASAKAKDEQVLLRMSEIRGVCIEDLQARDLCKNLCQKMYGKSGTRYLNTNQRLALSQALRRQYRLSIRQISMLVRIEETELHKYVK